VAINSGASGRATAGADASNHADISRDKTMRVDLVIDA
jgi:hypothetical protein